MIATIWEIVLKHDLLRNKKVAIELVLEEIQSCATSFAINVYS